MTKRSKDSNTSQLLKFPCDFPIKIVSRSDFKLEDFATSVVHTHIPRMEYIPIKSNQSSNGNYQAITVTIKAENQKQIDSIYQDLTANKSVLMVL